MLRVRLAQASSRCTAPGSVVRVHTPCGYGPGFAHHGARHTPTYWRFQNPGEYSFQAQPGQCSDDLWLWLEADEKIEHHCQLAQRRIGYCSFSQISRVKAGDDMVCVFRHMSGQVVGQATLKVVANTMQAPAQPRDFNDADTVEAEQLVQRESRYYAEHVGNIEHLSRWRTGGKMFPVGKLPLWAFVDEYYQPNIPQPESEAFLLHLFEHALWRLRVPPYQPHRQFSVNELLEFWGEMCTLIPVTSAYRYDTAPGDDEDEEKTVRGPEDQWVHPLAMSSLRTAGFDCEDAASVMYLVGRLCQLQPLDNTGLPNAFLQICELARRYTLFFTLGALKIPGANQRDTYTYHAYVTAFDNRLVQSKLTGGREDYKPLPPLAFEGTEYTTSNLNYNAWPQVRPFRRLMFQDPRVHGKIPSAFLRSSHQYREVVELVSPGLFEDWGTYSVSPVRPGSGGKLGVSYESLASAEWKTGPAVTVAQQDLVRRGNFQMPRIVLPVLPQPETVFPEFPPVKTAGTVVLGIRGVDMTQELERQLKAKYPPSRRQIDRVQLWADTEYVYVTVW